MEITVIGGRHVTALYRVDQDGALHFGGGLDGRLGKTSWTGQMSAGEIQELRDLLTRHDWFGADPVSTGDPPGWSYDIKLTWPQGRRSFRVIGRSPAVDPIEEFLDRIARRRFDAFLDTLPKPSSEQVPPESPDQSDR